MNLLSEIKKIKNMIYLFEGKDKVNEIAIIGDKIAYLLSNAINNEYEELIDQNMNFQMLNDRLSNYGLVEDQVKDVFISIGSEDFFNVRVDIDTLIDNLDRIFPNAELHLIKGYINTIENNIDQKNIDMLEDNSKTFFDIFKKNRVEIVGNHEIVGFENTELGTDLIIDLIEIIKQYVGISDDLETEEPEVEVIKFSDLGINDDTDFDEIYEFLGNIEKMIKSKNKYSIDLKNNYFADVEIIQIALKFLDSPYSHYIEINGKYDEKTKTAIQEYQLRKGIKNDGIANNETLEEILWDLKVKSFDEEDLSKFIKGIEEIVKTYTPDVFDLEDIVDKIIDNIEGGYAAPEHFRASAEKQKDPTVRDALLRSGETMFGIDRKNGPKMDEFWEIVDENSGYAPESAEEDKWTHGYMGGDVEDELRELVYEWVIPYYEDLKNTKLSSELKRLIEEDKRLASHFMYACWNGIVFYDHFVGVLEDAIDSGVTDRDELWEIAINSRKNHSNGVARLTAPKVEKIANM